MKKTLISFIVIAACLFSFASYAQDEADAAGNTGGDTYCANEQTVMACTLTEEGDFESCEPTTLCLDAATAEGSSESEDSILSDIVCFDVQGTTGNDIIYLGAVYQCCLYGFWYTLGDFGICKNGVFNYCNFVADDLPIVGYAGSDTMGTRDSLLVCPSGSNTAIGSWSPLRDQFRDTRFHMYGCQGNDTLLRGTPNVDTIIGGSGGDTIYGLDGPDTLCGDRESSGTCSESSCTSDSGYGNDTIHGGAGSDYIIAGKGSDTAYGENGIDIIMLGEETLSGGCSANDDCTAYPYHNLADGGYGDDIIRGGQYCQNWMWGSYDNDIIWGCEQDDRICGGAGVWDDLEGQGGHDIVVDCLSSGETLPDIAGEPCDLTLYGGGGDDVVCYKNVGIEVGVVCLDADGHVTKDWCSCDGETVHCKDVGTTCESWVAFSPDCTANGDFTCNCP